ncbi:MAG TPA: 5-formyltetrahydrofolate cyclo-ligase [Acidimicrobiia bacterium]|nr:5-formyltetrahydrofolate cyclo-ligase [Acidimicrobiia bacterium]
MDKTALREEMRALGPLAPGVSEQITDALFGWLSSRLPATISAFLPMEGEVDLRPLMGRLPGWRWVLPRVEPDRSVTFRDAGLPRETHRFGMEQPIDSGTIIPLHEIDVFLVPGLAFDRAGRRLGNGAGHYDRILSGARGDAVSIGMAPLARVVDVVPTDAHDVRVGWLATETGVLSCPPNG